MTDFNAYYRTWAHMQDTLKSDFTYNYISGAMTDADQGEDEHSGKTYARVIDMDWVETIEDTILYLDKAIREERRFIEQLEDVVPIEKARKITSESVRHLGQHTNLIARVEGDSVTPERILDIQREESFAIYENRFLKTLLDRTIVFVEDRYKALKNAPTDSFSKVHMKRHLILNQQTIDVELSYACESRERLKVDLNADVTTLSDFERVVRIRQVLADFMSSNLMRALIKAEPVRPPILSTNLMTKNPNFKKAKELWLFIETYKKPGVEVVGQEYSGKMEEKVQKHLYDVLLFGHFIMNVGNNEPWIQMLHERYLEENAQREVGTEAGLKKYEELRIAQIREEEMQIRLEEIRAREKQIGNLRHTVNSQKLTIRQREDTIKELKGSLHVANEELQKAKDKAFALENKLRQTEEELADKTKQLASVQAELEEQVQATGALREEVGRLEGERAMMLTAVEQAKAEREEMRLTLEELQVKYSTLEIEIKEAKASLARAQNESREAREEATRQAAISAETEKKHVALMAELARVIEENSNEKDRLAAEHAAQLAAKDKEYEKQERKLRQELEKESERRAAELKQEMRAEVEQREKTLAAEMEQQKKMLAADRQALAAETEQQKKSLAAERQRLTAEEARQKKMLAEERQALAVEGDGQKKELAAERQKLAAEGDRQKKELAAERQKLESAEKRLKQEAKNERARLDQEIKGERARLKGELQAEEQRVKQALDAVRQALRRDIAEGKDTLKKARKEAGEGRFAGLKKRWPW